MNGLFQAFAVRTFERIVSVFVEGDFSSHECLRGILAHSSRRRLGSKALQGIAWSCRRVHAGAEVFAGNLD